MSMISQINGQEMVSRYEKTEKKSKVYGRTVGEPKLSEEAQKYYEELKSKYSNMDFVLVSSDMKEQAKANAGSYARPGKTVVLIDEEKIERMAVDEEYRKQYEGILSGATNQLSQLKKDLGETANAVTGFGIHINDDGTSTLFASLDKSLLARKERMEKNAEKKAEEKKAEKAAEKAEIESSKRHPKPEDVVTVTANSVEELIAKIKEQQALFATEMVQTEQEKLVGQNFDFRL